MIPKEIDNLIRDGRYKIALRKISSLFFCYVYNGESYAASKRIEILITEVSKAVIWSYLQKVDASFKKPKQSESDELEAIVNEVFRKTT